MGLEKPRQNAPFIDLVIKIFFNCVFWVTIHSNRLCTIKKQFNWQKVLSETNLEAGFVKSKKIQRKIFFSLNKFLS